jgi:alkylhydroperoxidase family enzyme
MTEQGDHAEAHPVRIEPLPLEDWDEEVWAAMSVLPAEMRPKPGELINSLGVYAHHPPLGAAALAFMQYFRFHSTMSDRTRELLIIRTTWMRGGVYEYTRHARIARRVGITDEELVRITQGSDAPGWEPAEAVLLRTVEDLIRDFRVSDATWEVLNQHYSLQEIMDILFVVGAYEMQAMIFNTIGVEPEADLLPYPTGEPSDESATS